MNIYEIIDKVRRRPGMYIGHHSPTHLSSFLSGYQQAKVAPDNEYKEESEFHGFHDWVARRFGYYESTSGWAYMIEDQREDKEEALWLFFQLLDEYRKLAPEILFEQKYDSSFNLDMSLYSRCEKVWGSFKAISKPRPEYIKILEVLPNKDWVALVAFSNENQILDVHGADDVNKARMLATKKYGLRLET